MPIKRSQVSTSLIPERERSLVEVPVFYTDELLEANVYDLAYSSTHGHFLPYLFVGYSKTEKQDVGTWYFGNARMHEEMELAVKEDVKDDMQYVYGQIHFDHVKHDRGQLAFRRLILHGEISANEENRQEVINKLVSVINPRELEDEFIIELVTGEKWQYAWTKEDEQLQRTK